MFCAELFFKEQKVYKICAPIFICTKNSPKNRILR